MWVYQKSTTVANGTVYNVGYFLPTNGLFVTISTQTVEATAQSLCNYLNGGTGSAIT